MKLKDLEKFYPCWTCHDCGEEYGKRSPRRATWHRDTCGVCGEVKSCTEPRDYGHFDGDAWLKSAKETYFKMISDLENRLKGNPLDARANSRLRLLKEHLDK